MAINDGGPAFPQSEAPDCGELVSNVYPESGGMTLRQWYAGLAMQGFLSSDVKESLNERNTPQLAFAMADAMIAYELEEDSRQSLGESRGL